MTVRTLAGHALTITYLSMCTIDFRNINDFLYQK
jgi:hypothetical protein